MSERNVRAPRSREPAAALPARDMEESAFTLILRDVLPRIPGAVAVALVDRDGEAVDYAGPIDPFEVKVAGAHFRIVLEDIARQPAFGVAHTVVCLGTKGSILARGLPDGYALVVLLTKRAGFARCERALMACERALALEAAWPIAVKGPVWVAVHVDIDRRRRPTRVYTANTSSAVEVLGALMGLQKGERGFRVRFAPSGHEVNLVHEAGGGWFVDARLG